MNSSSTKKINENADLKVNNSLLQKEFQSTSNDTVLYDSFLSLLQITAEKDNKVFLYAPEKILKVLESDYKEYIYRCVNQIYPVPKEIILSSENITSEKIDTKKILKREINSNINSNLTFSNYAEGKFNERALLGARSVIDNENDEALFNPLFIHAPSGLGKTHLLHAIGNELIKKNKTCFYINPDFFTRELVEHLKAKNQDGINKIVDQCNQYDCLMFDDVQQFGNRDSTLNVLFNIINNHINTRRQIIISADKTPQELGGFEERFITRFSGGITFEISNPDIDDVIKIFKFKFKNENIDASKFDDECFKFLARNFSNSIRSVEGAVNKIKLFHDNDKKFRYDLNYLKLLFSGSEQSEESITPDKILDAVSKYYKIERKKLTQKTRVQQVVRARRICMWLIKDQLNLSYNDIGQMLGGQTHSSVIAGVNFIDNNMKRDSSLNLAISKIRQNLKKIL